MRSLAIACCCLAFLLVGWLASTWSVGDAPVPGALPAATGELDELRAEVAALTRRLAALEQAAPVRSTEDRANAFALEPRPTSGGDPHDARWYLEQYTLSFGDDAQGSEYYRLAVDAHVVELVSPIAALVRDGGRPVALRIQLATMLGKRRFDDSLDVIDALLAAVRPPAPDALALRALEALGRIASRQALPGLEACVLSLREPAVRERALSLLVELAGEAANDVLLRLFLVAPDDVLKRLLIKKLDGGALQAAHDLLRAASGGDQPVRLDAARKTGEYDEPMIDALVAAWRPSETDAMVLAALGGDGQSSEVPGWSARKATGPPDAERTRDDPNAWASKQPDMGKQWLQLTYATPTRAHGVRIFEVNVPGAVAEVLARGPDGAWVTLWRGTADRGDAPLVLSFALTAFPVRTIRVVLDTNRKPGWNEIDAVELLGPGGGQWATRASASSTYANAGGGGGQLTGEQIQLLQSTQRRR